MVDINLWMNDFLKALEEKFKDRVLFAGLQGSYARDEADEGSDIDAVVILDELKADDISAYNEMLDTLPHRDLACGFLSGRNDLLRWEASDLLSLYYDTKPFIGSLDEVLTVIDDDAVRRAVKIGACNIYHGCVHNMLYEKSENVLRSLYKSAMFVVKAICLRDRGEYPVCQEELLQKVSSDDKIIVEIFYSLKNGSKAEFHKMSRVLFEWAKSNIG